MPVRSQSGLQGTCNEYATLRLIPTCTMSLDMPAGKAPAVDGGNPGVMFATPGYEGRRTGSSRLARFRAGACGSAAAVAAEAAGCCLAANTAEAPAPLACKLALCDWLASCVVTGGGAAAASSREALG